MTNLQQLYDSWKNRSRPNVKWKMAGDMPGRLPWLVENFSGLDTITEFGSYQGCSTAGWLMCKPKKLLAVDWGSYLDVDLYKAAAAKAPGKRTTTTQTPTLGTSQGHTTKCVSMASQ